MKRCAFLLGLACLSAPAAAAAAESGKPNVLVLLADDLGYADVGFHGCRDIPTPHLDRLAADGVRFTNGYVSGPYCSPTRAGLLTGRYQQRFGHEFNPGGGGAGLPPSEATLADRLGKAGYATALVGKWHLGGQAPHHPQARGFQEFFGFLGGAHDYFAPAGLLRGREPAESKEYLTDAIARECEEFVRRQRARPWFLCATFNAVHTPLQADDARLKRFAAVADPKRRVYAAMTSALDDAVGRIRKSLVETGQAENTLVIFFSDNGGPTMPGTTTNGSSNAPLRGSKRTTLEGGVRVPFVLHWPGHTKPGVFERPVIQLDAHATALAAAGAAAEGPLDGVDLLPYLNRQKTEPPHDALFWRFGKQMAIRVGDWKLVRYDLNADTDAAKQGVSEARLYDLAADIGESRDRAADQPEKVRELQARWDAWNATLVKPLWGQDAGPGVGPKQKKKSK